MIHTRQVLLGSCAALVLFAMTSPAQAQQAAPAPSAGLDEVIVTAEKRKENLQVTPVAVTAFSAAQIENSQQRDVTDLSSMVPLLQISQSGSGPNSSIVTLRGLSFQDIEKSFEPPIGIVVDGVYLSTSTGQIAQVFDFDHEEVSAGPQGTLFGKNTTGGVVNITRSKPNPDDTGISGKVRLTGGNFGEHDGEAVVNATLVPGKLAVKLAAFSQNNDGAYKDVTLGHNIGARSYQAFSFGADWRPTDNSDVYVVYDRTLDHSQLSPQISALTPNALPLPVGGFIDGMDAPCLNPNLPNACVNASGKNPGNVATADAINKANYALNAVTVNASVDLDQVKLVSVSGARFSTEDSHNDYDATQYPLFNTNRPEEYRQLSEEFRAETSFNGPVNLVAGVYYFYSNYTLNQYSILDFAAVAPIPTGLGSLSFGQYTQQASKNESIFFQGNYDATEQLRVIVGSRMSWDQKEISYGLYSDPTGSLSQHAALTPGSSAYATHDWAQFTPKIGVEYKLTPDVMGYASYTEGYNAAGYNGRAATAAVIGPYAAEQVHSFEVGSKTSWFDNRLRINGDLFLANMYHAQLDEIVATPVAPFTGTTVNNAANIRYQGAELEIQAKPMPNWTVQTNVGLMHAYYTRFDAALLINPATGIPVVIDNSSLKVRRTPDQTVGFNSDYVIPLETGQVGINGAVRYISSQQFDLLNDPRGYQGPVTKVDASLRYNRDVGGANWTLTGFCKNITNETPHVAFVTGYQGSFVEFWANDVGRTYGVTLQTNF